MCSLSSPTRMRQIFAGDLDMNNCSSKNDASYQKGKKPLFIKNLNC